MGKEDFDKKKAFGEKAKKDKEKRKKKDKKK